MKSWQRDTPGAETPGDGERGQREGGRLDERRRQQRGLDLRLDGQGRQRETQSHTRRLQGRERDGGESYDYSHFSDEETEARSSTICPSYRMSKQPRGI